MGERHRTFIRSFEDRNRQKQPQGFKIGIHVTFLSYRQQYFYDKVGNLKVNEMEFGGNRNFNAIFNVSSSYSEMPGTFGEYLKIILASNQDTQNFAFFPVLNDSISSDTGMRRAWPTTLDMQAAALK